MGACLTPPPTLACLEGPIEHRDCMISLLLSDLYAAKAMFSLAEFIAIMPMIMPAIMPAVMPGIMPAVMRAIIPVLMPVIS